MKTTKEKHIDALNRLYVIKCDKEHFFRVARRLECKLEREAERYCSIPNSREPNFDNALKRLLALVKNKRKFEADFYGNSDPRGYALKINNDTPGLCKDWGGYGIIAPIF